MRISDWSSDVCSSDLIEDITRRLALEGFIAFAPDALFPLGGYPGDEDAARALFGKLDQDKVREDFLAAAGFLREVEGGNGRHGTVGFCRGGAMAHRLATRLPAQTPRHPGRERGWQADEN